MSGKTMVTSSFNDRDSAERAYQSVLARGYKPAEVHLLMLDDTRKRYFGRLHHPSAMDNQALAIAAAAATVAVTGVGLVVAGPLADALAGAPNGATAGGVAGTLVSAGVPEDRAQAYEKDLQDGRIVVGVTPRTPAEPDEFENERDGQHLSH